ncbi:hypothetical protein CL617_01020 [archaeon]|nr:hypothetical protein [archaeon]
MNKMNQNKPKLVRIVGIIELLRPILGLVTGFLGAGFLSIFIFQGGNLRGIFGSSILFTILAIVSVIVNVIAFIGAIAVIRYKPIGRKLIIFVAISMIILNIVQNSFYSFSTGGLGGLFEILWIALRFFPIIYYGALIYYFMTSEVKNAFQPN